MDKYSCRCGQKYTTNSSLYNHIRLKHDNDLSWKLNTLKMGRPIGTKNEVTTVKKVITKRVPYPCKCGANLASRGALSNHWRLVHKNSDDFKPDMLEKGRKRIHPDQSKELDIIQTKQEQIEQQSSSSGNQHEQSISTHISYHEELDQKLLTKNQSQETEIMVKYNSNDDEVKQQIYLQKMFHKNTQQLQQVQQVSIPSYDLSQQVNGQLLNNQYPPYLFYNYPIVNNNNGAPLYNFYPGSEPQSYYPPPFYYPNYQQQTYQPFPYMQEQHFDQYNQGFNQKANQYLCLFPQSQQRVNF